MLGLGLHPFIFKFNYGFFGVLEAGINFDFCEEKNLVEILQGGYFNLKYMPLNEEDHFVSVAAGLRQAPVDLFGAREENDFTLYAVAARKFMDYNFNAGVKTGLSGIGSSAGALRFLANIGKVINDTVLLAAEYDGHHINAGVKISLNYNINIDMFINRIDRLGEAAELGDVLRNYFVFGITYIQ